MANVPDVPGVPPLTSFSANTFTLLTQDAASLLAGIFLGPQWGIFLDGVNVIESDNTVDFAHKQDFPVSDYPVEQGGFQSYDKVQLPGDVRVRVSAGGSVANRQAFLASIDAVMNTLDLYDVVTPEEVYVGYNFTHRDLHRAASSGAGLIVVDLWLIEVRVTSTTTFQTTQQPGNAGQQSIGNQEAVPYPSAPFSAGAAG